MVPWRGGDEPKRGGSVKVARIHGIGDLRLEDVDRPSPGPRDILVKTRASGICSSDFMPWYIQRKAPLVFGHEPAGEVVEVGVEVTEFKPGDRVFAHHHAPCFRCNACRRGAYAMCETWKKSRLDPGGMSEYFRVPETNLTDTLLLPGHLSYEDGALLEPTGCVVRALKRARIVPGDTLLVIGLGVMGQMLTALGHHFGAKKVIASDFVASRRDMALGLGADAVIDPAAGRLPDAVRELNGGRLADVVIVGPPFIQAMEEGLTAVEQGGTVVLFSPTPPGEMLTFEPHWLYFNDITLVPSYSAGPDDTRDALTLFREGVLSARDIVTHRYPLSQVGEAYQAMARGGNVVKAMILFD